MVGIVDYGMGNLMSVKNALDHLGEANIICTTSDELRSVDRIILPGIGGFPDCMKHLNEKGFIPVLNKLVLEEKTPILGICLGMQVMAKQGTEFENINGLGWFDATVINIRNINPAIKVPNVGWEDIIYNRKSPLFKRLGKKPDFYLVHSFFMQFDEVNSPQVDAYYELLGYKITAAVRKDNIFGTQFHPEKSSDVGMTVLTNFLDF